jgi:hypothetical protein
VDHPEFDMESKSDSPQKPIHTAMERQARCVCWGITVNAPITINGPVADQGNLTEILDEHAREIARQVKRAFEIEYEQEAVV